MTDRWPKDKSAIFVSQPESVDWQQDANLRQSIQRDIQSANIRLLPVCTLGGFIVDVWTDGSWQSGLP